VVGPRIPERSGPGQWQPRRRSLSGVDPLPRPCQFRQASLFPCIPWLLCQGDPGSCCYNRVGQ